MSIPETKHNSLLPYGMGEADAVNLKTGMAKAGLDIGEGGKGEPAISANWTEKTQAAFATLATKAQIGDLNTINFAQNTPNTHALVHQLGAEMNSYAAQQVQQQAAQAAKAIQLMQDQGGALYKRSDDEVRDQEQQRLYQSQQQGNNAGQSQQQGGVTRISPDGTVTHISQEEFQKLLQSGKLQLVGTAHNPEEMRALEAKLESEHKITPAQAHALEQNFASEKPQALQGHSDIAHNAQQHQEIGQEGSPSWRSATETMLRHKLAEGFSKDELMGMANNLDPRANGTYQDGKITTQVHDNIAFRQDEYGQPAKLGQKESDDRPDSVKKFDELFAKHGINRSEQNYGGQEHDTSAQFQHGVTAGAPQAEKGAALH